MPTSRRFIAACVAVCMLGGCSLVFTSGPPVQHRKLDYFDCSRSRVVPILDTLFTALEATTLGVLVADDSPGPNENRTANIAVAAGFVALGATSMYVGFNRVSRCKAATVELWQRMSERSRQASLPEEQGPRE